MRVKNLKTKSRLLKDRAPKKMTIEDFDHAMDMAVKRAERNKNKKPK